MLAKMRHYKNDKQMLEKDIRKICFQNKLTPVYFKAEQYGCLPPDVNGKLFVELNHNGSIIAAFTFIGGEYL